MKVAIRHSGIKEVLDAMDASGRDVRKSARAGVKAGAVHIAQRIHDNSPVDTGAMQESLGMRMIGDRAIIEQVAPYTEYVDYTRQHFTGTYYNEVDEAFRLAVSTANKALRAGTGPESVDSPFPLYGVYSPRLS